VCRSLSALGVDVTIATSSSPDRPNDEIVDGIRIVRGGDFRHGVHLHARRFYERSGGCFDVVLDEINTRPFAAPSWATSSTVVAVAFQVAREVWFAETPWPVAVMGRYLLEPRWLRGYQQVDTFTISASSARSLAEYGLRRVHVLPMGADLAAPAQPVVKETTPTFAFVGRLSASKRPEHAIEAFRQARAELPDARLWVMGTGPCEASLRRRLPPGVELLGRVSEHDKLDRLARAHALVVTSVREGWGLVVSEAAAVGTWSIAYEVDGLVDAVPAAGGVLVPPDPTALARAMVSRTPDLLGRGAPESHGTVGWDVVAAELLDRLDQLAGVGAAA